MNKLFAKVLNIGKAVKDSSITRKALSSALALTVVLTPLSPAIAVSADEIAQDNEVVEETTVETEASIQETEVAAPVETTVVPDYSEYATEETTVIVEDEDLITSDPTEEIDATAPPTEQETESTVAENATTEETVAETTVESTAETTQTESEKTVMETEPEVTVEEKTSNIVFAKSADEYYKLISSLPDGYQRVIVDTYADLSELDGADGVYYDGTYILVFDDSDSYTNAVKVIHDKGYEYAIDGTLSVCGNTDGVISYGSINPSAKVKVAVIDTGSNLANEKYSVIGDDTADHNGHGTAMSSLILDETSNAYIVSIKALDDNGHGNMSDVYAAVQLAEDLGVDYILMAVSIRNSGKYDAFISLIMDTKATVVAAAGNSGADASKYLPAGIDGVITVGAVDDEYYLRSFSNYGTCVEYYEIADSTSEASAKSLGKIISGKALNTMAYITDDHWYEEGSECYFDIDAYFPNANEWVDVDANLVGTTYLYTYSENSGSYDGHFHKTLSDYSNIAYCVQVEKVNPWSTHYHGVYASYGNDEWTSGSVSGAATFQAAMACGPGGNLYRESLLWWKNYLRNHPSVISGYTYEYGRDVSLSNGTTFSPNVANFDIDHATANEHYFMYLVTHLCADWALTSSSTRPYDVTGAFGKAVDDYYYDFLKAARKGDFSQLDLDYEITTSGWWGTIYYNTEGDSTYQHIGRGNVTVTRISPVPLTIEKASSDPSISGTMPNSAYDFAGTTYELYSGSTKVATFVMKSDGTTNTVYEARKGMTYTLKETKAGKGFELDTKTYTITVSSNGIISINNGATVDNGGKVKIAKVKDTPDDTNISLTKASSVPSVTNGNSCYSLAGTSYGLYSDQACTNRVATFTVDASGKTTTTYRVAYGKTYYLKEITAGKGYNLDSTVYKVTVSTDGKVSVDNNATTTVSGNTIFINVTDKPGRDPLYISIKKIDKNGSIVHNATLTGAVFRLYYYAQDLGASGNNDSTPTVIYEVTASSNTTAITLADLRYLTPVGGSNPDYLKNVPASWTEYPYGTIRIQEIKAPVGYRVNDQVLRYRLLEDGNTPVVIESNSAYGNRNYWKHQQDGSWDLTELPKVGSYALTKSLDDTAIRSSLAGFKYELYNTSSKSSPVQIATGVSQSDGRILWTYTVPNYYKNTDVSVLLTGTTTYELELPATEKNASGSEVAIQYEVREIKSSIAIAYGNSGIPYTYSAPLTEGKAWNNATDYYYKTVIVSNDAVKREGVTNNYEFTGLSVKKVVPSGNPFDTTKVTFKIYNTDGGKDTLIATGSVDSKGNITWTRTQTSGYGTAPKTSVNVINYLPLGHYRVEESWNKSYINAGGNSILITEKNNSGWTKTETSTTYTYSYNVDLSAKSNDGKIKDISVENEREAQEFNLSKVVTVAGDASTVKADLYLTVNNQSVLIATGTCKTNGVGTYGFTWDYAGTHTTKDGLDTLVLPVGKYRVVEHCPETYYKDTKVPYTYMTPSGFTATSVNGKLQFYKDFELKAGSYTTLKSSVTNVRIEASFDIIKVERSEDGKNKTFNFEIYYRGNGTTASNTAILVEKVTITTTNGKGSATLSKLPEGWYEIREVGAASSWTAHWANDASVVNGNKVIHLSSNNRTIAAPTVNDGIKENGKTVNGVLIYNDVAPEIKTTLVDRATEEHIASLSDKAELVDTVSYTHLMPGHYVMSGVLMDKASGKALLDKNGKEIVGSVEFDVPFIKDEFGNAKPQSGSVKVTFTLDTTRLEGVTLVAYEELRSGSVTGTVVAEHKDINDVDQTIQVPKVRTTLKDSVTNAHVAALETVTLIDTVKYDNLIVGKKYSVTGILVNADTGVEIKDKDGKVITSTTEFTAKAKSGTVEITFKVDPELLKGTTVVAFEDMYYNNIKVATHADIKDEEQTVYFPDIRTTLIDNSTGEHITAQAETIKLTDTVSYTNLKPGLEYTMSGTLMDKKTGKELLDKNGNPVTSEVTFTPEAKSGTVKMEFEFDGSLLKGVTLVAYETLIYDKKIVAVHNDINDVDQTVDIPDIHTTFFDKEIGDDADFVRAGDSVTLVDRVYYTNLKPGLEYRVTGIVMVKDTNEPLLNENGEQYSASVTFTPKTATGYVDVEFTVNTKLVAGKTLVAFETLKYKDITLVIHADINDVDQTVHVPDIKTTATDANNGTHTLTYKERVDIRDKVAYTNLIVGRTYVVTGTLYNAKTGEIYKDTEGKTYTASTEFTAETADGFVYVDFKSVVVPYEKTTIVVFEDLSDKEKGVTIAVHADITDEEQTVERPTASTTATVDGAKAVWLGSTEVRNITITDTITYTGFEVGNTYRAVATLYKSDGTPITSNDQPVVSMIEFVPTTKDGSVDVNITFSTAGLSEGDRIVVFEAIFDVATKAEIAEGTQTEDILIARHEDLGDDDQTITIHFRPSTGEITPTYIKIGAALLALSTFVASIFIRRKKKLLPPAA